MTQKPLFAPKTFGSASASLDPLETPVEPNSTSTLFEDAPAPYALSDDFRHSGWKHHRQLIFQAMCDLTKSGHRIELSAHRDRRHIFLEADVRRSRVESFRTCGHGSWILQNRTDPTRFRLVPDHCHDRWCVPCSAARRITIRNNLAKLLHPHPHRFLTLTIRHADEPLTSLIRKLYAAFRRLRQRQFWKDRVFGGVAFLEVSFNTTKRQWHPHLHCVIEGSYLHHEDLRRAWLESTGDSYNVDIRLVRNPRQIVDYISKYSTKPVPPAAIDDPLALREAIVALTARRFLIQFGTWRNWRLLATPTTDEWSLYCHADQLTYKALDDDPVAANVLSMMNTADPFTGEFIVDFQYHQPDT